MKELSLHILDIAQNSITAGASLVQIEIAEDTAADTLTITVTDNGKGMSEEFLKKVRDPFTTTRKTRPVGMGISLFESAAKACDGGFDITSKLGAGTTVKAWFKRSHIDREPIGDMAETFVTVIGTNPDIDYTYTHIFNGESFCIDTREMRKVLGEVPLTQFEVVMWIKDSIYESLNNIMGGYEE